MFLVGIVFAKSYLTTQEIGRYETFLFLAGAVTFFWLNGIIASLLPVHKNNESFKSFENSKKSPEFFNAFILIFLFSAIASLLIYNLSSFIETDLLKREIPYKELLSLYVLLGPAVYLIEFMFLLLKKPKMIIIYGSSSFLLQFVFIVTPILLNLDLQYAIIGLLSITLLRWILLIFLLVKYSIFKVSFSYLSEHLKVGIPLILSSLLSGSAQYIDGFIISNKFNEEMFAIFRYGAREFPFVVILANAFSSSMTPEFKSNSFDVVLERIKNGSIKLMHIVFPTTIIFLLISNWIYPIIFNESFALSAKIFNIYLILVVSRMVFPQTILIGLKKTKFIMLSSFIEISLNVTFSLIFVQFWGIIGVAFATIIAYVFDKVFLILINYFVLKISPQKFIAFRIHFIYSIITVVTYLIVDFLIFA
jgi:O-antigen/teichoic acid export membrane protein